MKKSVIISCIAVVALAAAVYFGIRQQQRYAPIEPQMVIENFADKISRTTRIALSNSIDGTIHLVQAQDGWVLEESSNFPIRLPELRNLISTLGESKKLESRSGSVDDYATYGLQGDQQSGFTAYNKDGDALIQLTIGARMNQLEGWYARIGDDPLVWVISGELAIDTRPRDWLVRDLLDIPATGLTSIQLADATVINQQGTLVLQKPGEDKLNQPNIKQLGNALANLMLINVRESQPDLTGDTSQITYATHKGLVVTVTRGESDDPQYWIQLDSQLDRQQVLLPDPAGDVTVDDAAREQQAEQMFAEATRIHETIQNRFVGYWIQIPSIAGKALGYTRKDLIQLPEDSDK